MAPGRFLVGDAAPEVNLRDATGSKFQLSRAVKERAWLLVFARTPEDAIDLELAVPGLNELGIGSALIAPFGQDKLSATVSTPHFRLLPDRASRLARVYGQYDAVSSNPRQGIVLVDRRGKIRLVMSGGIPTSSEIVRLSREALEIAGELPVTG
jgi:peroxiredoxin